MRLTNQMRNAFVREVISKLPHKDYVEEIRQVAYKDAFEQCPKAVQDLLGQQDQMDWVNWKYWYFANTTVRVPSKGDTFVPREKVRKQLETLKQAANAQYERDKRLTGKLLTVALGCMTTAQLREALPEFAKYVPEDPVATVRTLPTLTGVVEEFKRAGWKS